MRMRLFVLHSFDLNLKETAAAAGRGTLSSYLPFHPSPSVLHTPLCHQSAAASPLIHPIFVGEYHDAEPAVPHRSRLGAR